MHLQESFQVATFTSDPQDLWGKKLVELSL